MDINKLFTEHLQGSHNPITRQLSQRNFDRNQRKNAPYKRVHAAPSITDILGVPPAQSLTDVLRVPTAPLLTNLPEDLSLLEEGPLDVHPSQYLPMTQSLSQRGGRHDIDRPTPVTEPPSVEKLCVSERGDADDLYLGSQFPLVHRVGASQVQRFGDNRTVQVYRGPTQHDSGQTADIYSPTSPVPNTSRLVKKSRSGFKTPQVDSQEDLFADDVSATTYTRAPKDTVYTPACLNVPFKNNRDGLNLRSVKEIPEHYQKIFNFPYFNVVQSIVFDNVMYTDKPLVLCSPTGSGKTAVFEMAIIRLLTRTNAAISRSLKIVYMAPIKALCSERFADWKTKFEPYGLKVMELTGDTMLEEFFELQEVNIILTTPEKWDSMTRRWRDNRGIVQAICLFLIDEIHVLNDAARGATVEVVLSRMKTIQAARSRSNVVSDIPGLRFVAASATITNIEDLAEWLGNSKNPAVHYKLDDSVRPVRLRKVVLGYNFIENKQSEFQFDLSLSYKLAGIINTYSEDKPTLVFCATRKSAMQGADILAKDMKSSYVYGGEHRKKLQNLSFQIRDSKLRDLVAKGIAYHHAGMDQNDRRHVEEIFSGGDLPVLVATSTLAMGVNLPAHLVVIKSTMYYHMGSHSEYPDTQVLQMIGRAGRPQFDTSATAVIMTKNQTKMKYDNLMNGTQLIESSLHKNLIEHLNAEIVLKTITDMSVAVEWLKYTFLYIRVMKNPKHYGIPMGLSRDSIEKRLQDMCMNGLNQLHARSLISMNEDTLDVKPTETGRLMARYCISYTTMERFLNIKGSETIADLIEVVSKCEEFTDLKLRTNEKKTLNTLNKDKNRVTIRFPMTGKIKTTEMKVNCLIQAQFGNLMVQDFSLQQDTSRIFRAGTRISRCLVDVLSQSGNYKSQLSATQLSKCFKAKLWENSKHVSKQLDGIGPALSTALVNAGLTTLEKIEETNPRELELIVNRHPPFGNQLKENIASIPKYELVIEQVAKYSMQTAEILISIQVCNGDILRERPSTSHTCTLLVGNQDNQVVYSQRIMDSLLLKENCWSKKLEIHQANKGPELSVHYVSQDWVGLDVECTYTPYYLGGKKITSSSVSDKVPKADHLQPPSETFQPCNHICHDKMACAHDCCKFGVSSKRRNNKAQMTPKPRSSHGVANHFEAVKSRMASLPSMPNLKYPRLQLNDAPPSHDALPDLFRFAYNPKRMLTHTVPETYDLEGGEPEEEFDWSVDNGGTAGNNQSHQRNGLSAIENTSSRNKASFRPGQAGSRAGQTEDMAGFADENRAPVFGGRGGKRPWGTSSGAPSALSTGQKKKTGWAELDLYQKQRENYVEIMDDGEDSLPDLDTVPCVTGGGGDPEWDMTTDLWRSEDIVEETDYGIRYIPGQDTSSMPLACRKNTFSSGEISSMSVNPDHQMIDQLGGNQYDHSRKSLSAGYSRIRNSTQNQQFVSEEGCVNRDRKIGSKMPVIGGVLNATGNRMGQNDMITVDFSDDSFDESIAAMTTTMPNTTQATTGSRLTSTDISQHSRTTRYHKTMRSDDNQNIHDTSIGGPHNLKSNHTSFMGNNEHNSIDCDNTACEEVIDSFSTDSDDKTSKWTGYTSSQSSTASDCLNSKHLTTNGDNQVIMKTSGNYALSQRQHDGTTGSNKIDSNRKRFWWSGRPEREQRKGTEVSRRSGMENCRDGSHRFGQVLAWVSDSQPKTHSPEGTCLERTGQAEAHSSLGTCKELAGQATDNKANKYSESLADVSQQSSVGEAARPPKSTFIFGKNRDNGSRLANIFEGLF